MISFVAVLTIDTFFLEYKPLNFKSRARRGQELTA